MTNKLSLHSFVPKIHSCNRCVCVITDSFPDTSDYINARLETCRELATASFCMCLCSLSMASSPQTYPSFLPLAVRKNWKLSLGTRLVCLHIVFIEEMSLWKCSNHVELSCFHSSAT